MVKRNDTYARRLQKGNAYQAIPKNYWRTPALRDTLRPSNGVPDRRPRYVSWIDDPRFWVTRQERKPLMWFHRKQEAEDYAFICKARNPDVEYDVMGV